MNALANSYRPGEMQVDRMTVTVSAVYQSDALRTISPLSHAFDRIRDVEESPLQMTTKLSPCVPQEIKHTSNTPVSRWVLVHLQIVSKDEAFVAGANKNMVTVKDESGCLVTLLPRNEVVTLVHPGPLYFEADKTTCILKTMVMPY